MIWEACWSRVLKTKNNRIMSWFSIEIHADDVYQAKVILDNLVIDMKDKMPEWKFNDWAMIG